MLLQDVRCVIHYQLPASADVYVHRSGRTARGAQDGITIALVTPKEAGRYQGLQKAMDRPVPSDFPVDKKLMPSVSAHSSAQPRVSSAACSTADCQPCNLLSSLP